MMNQTTVEVDSAFFDAVAELGKLLGLSKSASLTLALLFMADEPLSLDEVAAQTGIAKSSISVILKSLEQMNLAETVDRANDRRKYYRVTNTLADAFAMGIAQRIENLTTRRQHILALESDSSPSLPADRLEQLQVMYHGLIQLSEFFRSHRAEAWGNLNSQLSDTDKV